MKNQATKKRVLVIEDEDDLRQLTSWAIEAEGYRVLQAASGEEGLELAYKNHIDLVLLDVKLPHRDGWSVFKEIKTIPAYINTPIILVTAYADEQNKEKALKLGAADYLVKPLSAKQLNECLIRVLP